MENIPYVFMNYKTLVIAFTTYGDGKIGYPKEK